MARAGGSDPKAPGERSLRPPGPKRLQELLREHFREIEERYEEEFPRLEVGLTTGFPELDVACGGLHPGRLVLLVGRPGSGKTTVASAVARRFARETGLGVVFFSLQSDRGELLHRLMAAEGRVSHRRLATDLEDDDWPKLTRAAGALAPLPLYVDDRPELRPEEIDQAVAGLAAEVPVRLAVVDHLALLGGGARFGPVQAGARAAVQYLARVARERDVCMLLVAELTGSPASLEDTRPSVSHLAYLGLSGRETGAVWLLDRSSEPAAGPREEGLVRVETFVPGTGLRGQASLVLCPETLEARGMLPFEADKRLAH
ncbi:MAG: DnaB-like helicase C-terminal domain-containing protein [Deferrisomatales bacterium]